MRGGPFGKGTETGILSERVPVSDGWSSLGSAAAELPVVPSTIFRHTRAAEHFAVSASGSSPSIAAWLPGSRRPLDRHVPRPGMPRTAEETLHPSSQLRMGKIPVSGLQLRTGRGRPAKPSPLPGSPRRILRSHGAVTESPPARWALSSTSLRLTSGHPALSCRTASSVSGMSIRPRAWWRRYRSAPTAA